MELLKLENKQITIMERRSGYDCHHSHLFCIARLLQNKTK